MLPPSPADSFLKGTHGMHLSKNKHPNIDIFPNGIARTAVLTGYNQNIEEINPNYQTMHDDIENLNKVDLVSIQSERCSAKCSLYLSFE